MGRFLTFVVLILAGIVALALWLTRGVPIDPTEFAAREGNAEAGRRVFLAAGCATCHGDRGSETQDAPILSGGRRLVSSFGTFVTPNISPDPQNGIGGWSVADLASALTRGVRPDGSHLYPVMPYTSFARMTPGDIADLKAFLDGLPASDVAREPSNVALPWSLRRTIGLWKQRYFDASFVAAAPSERLERGRYLVEALGHCAECHTPRDRFGGLDRERWMAGAPLPGGSSSAPNITPARLKWSRDEIVWYLESGLSPGGDEAGREMEDIIASVGQLPGEDLEAIAAYLQGLAPVQ